MKTIKLTLALLTFAICMGSCAMILGIDSNTLMKIQKGMTKEEITSILGQPMHRSFDHEVEGCTGSCRRGDRAGSCGWWW